MELQPASDDLDELPHGHVVGDQELGLVQHRQLLLAPEPLDDAGHLGGVLRPDLLHILHPQRCNDSVTFNNSWQSAGECFSAKMSQAGSLGQGRVKTQNVISLAACVGPTQGDLIIAKRERLGLLTINFDPSIF